MYIKPTYLDYADVIYDQPNNNKLCDQIESVQYRACLAITGCIKGTSKEKLFQELGLETLRKRRWYRRLVLFYKIYSGDSPSYLQELVPFSDSKREAAKHNLRSYRTKHDYFENSFFPYCVREWNKLSPEIRCLPTIARFKKALLAFIRPEGHKVFGLHNPYGVKLLSRLRMGLSHLKEHKFKHGFSDSVLPLCSCGLLESETTEHFLLRCKSYITERNYFLDQVNNLFDLSNLDPSEQTNILIFGTSCLDINSNKRILELTIEYLIQSGRFEGPLF